MTFAPVPTFDRKYVAFGKLVDGMKVLDYVQEMGLKNERPKSAVFILDAGIVSRKEAQMGMMQEDEAAQRIQDLMRKRQKQKDKEMKKAAVEKGEAEREAEEAAKDRKEQEEAAIKMQAINRGRTARKSKKA